MRRRTAADQTAAYDRLRAEQTLPVADLAGLPLDLGGDHLHPTAQVLLRWGMSGRSCGAGRAYLDVIYCHNRLTWVTSRPALARFVAVAGTTTNSARTT
ncbi:MAG TPA: hypothetical protein VD866_12770 [Urbifossiella sp.]|nr:hypothetical protein [Urbifossiella sp.]